MSALQNISSIPFDIGVMQSVYPECKRISDKAIHLEKAGKIIRLKRGLYIARQEDTPISRELIANHIYGPSYVSMSWALRWYGLIPEQVNLVQSVTTKHSRHFSNALGDFHYHRCSALYFPIGITMQVSGNAKYLIATPEKALCDYVCYNSVVLRFMTDVEAFLKRDLRIFTDALPHFDLSIIRQCAETGSKPSSLLTLLKYLQHERQHI